MVVPNFEVEVNADTFDQRNKRKHFQTRRKDDGFDATFFMRQNGELTEVLTVRGRVNKSDIDGKPELRFYIEPGSVEGDEFDFATGSARVVTER
jgi:hypothetical protein